MPDPRARRPWMRRRWVLVIAAILATIAVLAAVVVWAASRPRDASATTEVVTARLTDETTTVSLAGVLAPQQQATASFAVPGTVTSVDVKVGDVVSAGHVLARVGERDLTNAVSLAQAQASAARAQLETARSTDGATSAQIAAARAQVEAADAALDQAQDRLADAALTAPIAGVVAEVSLEVGDQVSGVSTTSALGTATSGLSDLTGLAGASTTSSGIVIVVPDAWQLEAQVGTADLPALATGQTAVVTPTGTEQHVAAVVDTIGIVASATSGQAATFPVTLRITDTSATLFSGADADAVVTTGTVSGVLTVPAEAIWITNDQPTVRQQRGDSVAVVEVTTGRRFGDRIEITAGLSAGDEILARRSEAVAPSASPTPTTTP